MVKNAYTLYEVLRSKTAMFKWIINDEQYRKKSLANLIRIILWIKFKMKFYFT